MLVCSTSVGKSDADQTSKSFLVSHLIEEFKMSNIKTIQVKLIPSTLIIEFIFIFRENGSMIEKVLPYKNYITLILKHLHTFFRN